ncbi:MAG: hypothetical protein RL660_2782 [Bacteroidota bacterium]|jgi:hypothetical protein
MKYYLHREILQQLRLPLLCLLIGIPWLIYGKVGFANCTFLLVGISFSFLTLRKLWQHRHTQKYYKHFTERPAILEGSSILFPDGYYFECSELHVSRRLEAHNIEECCINTWPISFVTKDREVVFVANIEKNDIEKFCEAAAIPIAARIDIWERINWPFLDTDFDEEEVIKNEEILAAAGIQQQELKAIRKEISAVMSANDLVWEWLYLGQFDYLSWTRLTKEKYWWSMEIALRNFKGESA